MASRPFCKLEAWLWLKKEIQPGPLKTTMTSLAATWGGWARSNAWKYLRELQDKKLIHTRIAGRGRQARTVITLVPPKINIDKDCPGADRIWREVYAEYEYQSEKNDVPRVITEFMLDFEKCVVRALTPYEWQLFKKHYWRHGPKKPETRHVKKLHYKLGKALFFSPLWPPDFGN